MDPRFSLFLRAIGIKPGFRRTGPSSLINIAFAAGVGVISGQYIFKEPLEEYWAEVRAREAAERAANGGSSDPLPASTSKGLSNAEAGGSGGRGMSQ